jgi:hypothetical protein
MMDTRTVAELHAAAAGRHVRRPWRRGTGEATGDSACRAPGAARAYIHTLSHVRGRRGARPRPIRSRSIKRMQIGRVLMVRAIDIPGLHLPVGAPRAGPPAHSDRPPTHRMHGSVRRAWSDTKCMVGYEATSTTPPRLLNLSAVPTYKT